MDDDESAEDPKIKQISDQLMQLICEAISSSSTEDKIWVPLEKIRNYVDTYFDGNTKDVEKNFVPTLRLLVKQELIVRRANTFAFISAETYLINTSLEKHKKQTKASITKKKTVKYSKK